MHERNGLTVFPVFYHVDPSHVRNQKGTFAEAFVKHGEDPDIHKKIQTWRVALKKVGNIAGWHLHDRDESTAIQEITGKILGQLNRKCSNVSEKLFGIDSPIDQTRNLLKKNSDGVCFVGICGMGGIGKDANDIVGLVLCASFSVPDKYSHEFLKNLESQVPHEYDLICLLDPYNFPGGIFSHAYFPTKKELKWISHLRGFNWLFYLPRWWLWNANGMSKCHGLTATTASKWSCLEVHKCAIQAQYLQDAQKKSCTIHRSHFLTTGISSTKIWSGKKIVCGQRKHSQLK
ncbi:hypothetical protein I3842_14G037600 [Carya illinoinensis]|uniref:TIR domain-containing protein n=1 Tax=Carya illinoinensis TaxID=32201 RepID=A0A922AIY2_CARIL|nr:hypothetical protein I3842_14G037600 [Carya illinoinensis]